MRVLKSLFLAAALLLPVALVPKATAQISINIGGPPPTCPYGYYGYAPYGCAPYGYYGSGYFYNGIFLGVGPWANWGYRNGWGRHRFYGPRGGRYWPRGYERQHRDWDRRHGGDRGGYRGGERRGYRGGERGGDRGGRHGGDHGGGGRR